MFAWICPKCGKEIPPQYDGCPEWCPEFQKQRAYLKEHATPAAEVTSPVLRNLPKMEGTIGGSSAFGGSTYTGATYRPGASLPPPQPDVVPPPPSPEAMRYRPSASAIAYETPLTQSDQQATRMPALADIRNQHPAAVEPPRQQAKEMNPFLVTILAAVVFLALGYAAYKYYEQSKGPIGVPAGIASSTGTGGGSHRLNRILRFAGMKFAPGKNKQIEAQFVLANESGAQTPTFSGEVAIRPKDAAATEPALLTFALSKIVLGPHESKQMRVPVDTQLKPYELPDSSMVRADLTITEPAD